MKHHADRHKPVAARMHWRQLIRWTWHQLCLNKAQALLNMGLGLGMVALSLFVVWTIKLLIDVATGREPDYSFTLAASLVVGGMFLEIVIAYASRWVQAILGVKAQNAMRRRLFRSALLSQWSTMERFHSGDVVNRIEKDVDNTVTFITESLPELVCIVVKFLAAFLFLYIMDHTLATVIVFLVPGVMVLSKLYIKKIRRLGAEIRANDSACQSVIQETLQHRSVIKALSQSLRRLAALDTLQEQNHQLVRQRTLYTSAANAVLNIGFTSGFLFTFIWGAYQLQLHAITYGTLMAFIQLVNRIQNPVRNMAQFVPQAANAAASIERIAEIESMPPEQTAMTTELNGLAGIRIEHACYAYEPRTDIIHDLSFDFAPGTSTAIIGPTGAGKTTLVRLLLALIEPSQGRLTAYDKAGHTEPVSPATRTLYSYVSQGNTLFSGTIRDNLLMGNAEASEADMHAALHHACADFVLDLPDGLQTPCGEHGYGFSEGQAQRIAIARALLMPGSILLLDEATSALDPQTELQLIQNISQHYADRTLIVVTHREAARTLCQQTLVVTR